MERNFKSLAPNEQFLTLLLGYYAVFVIKGIIAVLGSLHWFPYFQNALNSHAELTSVLITLMSLGILIMLYLAMFIGAFVLVRKQWN